MINYQYLYKYLFLLQLKLTLWRIIEFYINWFILGSLKSKNNL